MWYTRGRGQVGSVLEGLASWDGIGILFDSSAEDAQVSGDLLPPPIYTITLLPVPAAQAACHLPCRTAPPSACWPAMGTFATSLVGKGLSGLTPIPLLGHEGLSGDPHHRRLGPLPQPLTETPHPAGAVPSAGLFSELLAAAWELPPTWSQLGLLWGGGQSLPVLPRNCPTESSIHSTSQPPHFPAWGAGREMTQGRGCAERCHSQHLIWSATLWRGGIISPQLQSRMLSPGEVE